MVRQSDKQKIAETFQVNRWAPDVDLQKPSLPPPPIQSGERGLFGDIAAKAKPAAKPKIGSRPVYKFEKPDGAPYALAGTVL